MKPQPKKAQNNTVRQNPTKQPSPRANIEKKPREGWFLALLIVLIITGIAHYGGLNNDFVNWDDQANIIENKQIRSTSWENIKEIFTSDVIGNYNPLPILTFAYEYKYFGLEPFIYHFNNWWLHLLNVVLVFFVLRRLGLSRNATFIVALLFGIHPMRVESVAWATERKDVLFGIFYWASILCYIKYIQEKKNLYFFLIFPLFALSLFAKIQAVSLPLSLLCIDYFLKREMSWKWIWEKIPFFIMSLVIGLVNIYMLKENKSIGDTVTTYAMWQRLFIGSTAYLVYLYKVIFPYPMYAMYPYPNSIPAYYYPTMLAALGMMYLMWYSYKNDKRAILFGTMFFTVNIVFLLQIVGAGQGLFADRFSYIGYFGLFFIAGYYYDYFVQKYPSIKKVLNGTSVGVFAIFVIATVIQTETWANGGVLWKHVIKYETKVPAPYGNLGSYYREVGQLDTALMFINKGLVISSGKDRGGMLNGRGRVYFHQGKINDAYTDYTEAIKLDTTEGEFYSNRASTLSLLKRNEEALRDINIAILKKPEHENSYQTRFIVLQQLGKFEESIKDITTLMSYRPTEAGLWNERARMLRILKRPSEALPDLNKAITMAPTNGLYYYERARCYQELGNKVAARADVQMAQQFKQAIDPAFLQSIQ